MPKRDFFAKSHGREYFDRATKCVNALRGIGDPEAFVANAGRMALSLQCIRDELWMSQKAHRQPDLKRIEEWCDKALLNFTPARQDAATESETRGD